jgi:hypothetical protein
MQCKKSSIARFDILKVMSLKIWVHYLTEPLTQQVWHISLRGLLEKYPTFGREKETGLLGALDT